MTTPIRRSSVSSRRGDKVDTVSSSRCVISLCRSTLFHRISPFTPACAGGGECFLRKSEYIFLRVVPPPHFGRRGPFLRLLWRSPQPGGREKQTRRQNAPANTLSIFTAPPVISRTNRRVCLSWKGRVHSRTPGRSKASRIECGTPDDRSSFP